MFAKVLSATVVGLDGVLVEVETDILSGLPSFNIVGLPDKAVEEAKERVRSALKNSSAELPARRITVNLAPADLPKEGPAFDLPIAISLLCASEQLKADLASAIFLGELSLDGSLRPIRGALPIALLAKEKGIKNIFLPSQNGSEAAIIKGLNVFPVKNLRQLYLHLTKQAEIKSLEPVPYETLEEEQEYAYDLQDVRGQEFAKRALEIAAAGGHNILFKGPPGAGKTLLARTLPSILPPLTFEEALEVTKIYSISGLLNSQEYIIRRRPFRNPHHTTSHIGLVGGSAHPKPGEISLAHRGVLFLDEFPEFPKTVIEAMRQPMEDGVVSVSRASGRVIFPTRFMLVAAQNPCPCGFFGDATRVCVCSQNQILKYQRKISGPILDRIDIHLEVPAVKIEKITDNSPSLAESSQEVRKRVTKARKKAISRFGTAGVMANSEMSAREIKKFCKIEKTATEILKKAIMNFGLSARSYHKVIKIAQTIADLSDTEIIKPGFVLEALQYRPRMIDN